MTLFRQMLEHPDADRKTFGTFRDAVAVDLGSGALSPFAPLVPFVALGARRGIAIEPEKVADPGAAARAVHDIVAALVLGTTEPRLPVRGAKVLERFSAWDVRGLAAGRPAALDGIGIELRQTGVDEAGIEPGTVDLLTSVSFLEHVPDPRGMVEACARLLKPGGLAVHTIDGIDHRWYANPKMSALEFLRADVDDPIVAGCNRLRPLAFTALFEDAGLEVRGVRDRRVLQLDDATIAGFAPRFRSEPRRHLEVACATFWLRRR